MRSTKLFPVLLAVSVMAVGCSDYHQPLAPEGDLAVLAYGAGKGPAPQPVLVTLPFKADFSVWNKSDYTDGRCGGYPVFFLTMEGHGNATHLGKVGVRMTFCCNFATGAYWDTEATFVAANGDELWLTIPQGQIYPNFGGQLPLLPDEVRRSHAHRWGNGAVPGSHRASHHERLGPRRCRRVAHRFLPEGDSHHGAGEKVATRAR